jgi:hypothetical protein
MDEKTFVCPKPTVWNDIYSALCDVAKSRNLSKPPIPLILAAWWDTPAVLKTIRWNETVEWASSNRVDHLIPNLTDDQKHFLGD